MLQEILDQIADIDLVVNFKSVDCLAKKHFGSQICSHCGKSFNAISSESTSQNPCLTTRTRHSQLKPSAAVDTEEIRMEKFHVRSEQSKDLEEYYRKQRKLLNFHVAGGPGETWCGLLAALHLQHIDVSNSSRKLTNVTPVSAFTSRMQ